MTTAIIRVRHADGTISRFRVLHDGYLANAGTLLAEIDGQPSDPALVTLKAIQDRLGLSVADIGDELWEFDYFYEIHEVEGAWRVLLATAFDERYDPVPDRLEPIGLAVLKDRFLTLPYSAALARVLADEHGYEFHLVYSNTEYRGGRIERLPVRAAAYDPGSRRYIDALGIRSRNKVLSTHGWREDDVCLADPGEAAPDGRCHPYGPPVDPYAPSTLAEAREAARTLALI